MLKLKISWPNANIPYFSLDYYHFVFKNAVLSRNLVYCQSEYITLTWIAQASPFLTSLIYKFKFSSIFNTHHLFKDCQT